jgi:ABC-type transport system substrate-binding protein
MYKKRILKTLIGLILAAFLTGTVYAGGGAQNSGKSGTAASPVSTEAPKADTNRKTTANTNQRYPKIVIGIGADPQDLLPYNVNFGAKPQVYHNFYESLFDMQGTDYFPVMVKSGSDGKGYTVVDDLHWDVEIYDYIYDHAGNHINADDVVYSYKVLIDSGYNLKWGMYKSIEKIGDYKVRFTWTRPITGVGDLEFPLCRAIIFSKKAYDSGNFATAPVGTGPYKVTRFVSGSQIVLEAIDNYWQKDKSRITTRHEAHVQTIQYDIISESSQHVIALRSGNINFSEMIPLESQAEFERDSKFGVYVSASAVLYVLNLNTAPGHPGNDINFRLAVYYAINNEACSRATNGQTLPTKAWGSPFFSDYVADWENTPSYINTYDSELAKQYLAKSSYRGQTLKLFGESDETFKNLMTLIQSFLANVGIKVEFMTTQLTNNEVDNENVWELMLSRMGGGMQVGEWNRQLNREEFPSRRAMGFIDDPVLQQKYLDTLNVKNFGPAAMTDVHNYVISKAYEYAVATGLLSMVYSSDIAEVYLRESQYVLPGAFVYYLD